MCKIWEVIGRCFIFTSQLFQIYRHAFIRYLRLNAPNVFKNRLFLGSVEDIVIQRLLSLKESKS